MITSLFTSVYTPTGKSGLSARPSDSSACAVCGVATTGEPAFVTGLPASYWRRCPACVDLAADLAGMHTVDDQALRLAADILGHPVSPADRAAASQVLQETFRIHASALGREDGPGTPERWQRFRKLADWVAARAEQMHQHQTGILHPHGAGYGCAYCGAERCSTGYALMAAGRPSRNTYVCGDCRADLRTIRAAREQIAVREDRLAAAWQGHSRVPFIPAGSDSYVPYASHVGYVPFHEVPGARAGARWAYLEKIPAGR